MPLSIKDKTSLFGVTLFLLLTIWWVLINLGYFGERGLWHDLFSDIYGILALFGGLSGFVVAKKWGGFQSYFGKATIFLSLGLLLQFFGQISYSYYYYVLGIDNPYPCIGDFGYFGTIPLYVLGVFFIGKTLGIKQILNNAWYLFLAILVPALMLLISYFVFLKDIEIDWASNSVLFLTLSNPLGQAILISMAILTYLLSFGKLGGVMKNKILLLLLALCAQYLADFVFLYNTSRGEWVPGMYSDYLYLLAYFLMTLGIAKLASVYRDIKANK